MHLAALVVDADRAAVLHAALFPGLTDAVIALGNSLMGWAGRRP